MSQKNNANDFLHKEAALQRKVLYTLRRNLRHTIRDLAKWLLLAPAGWFIKKNFELETSTRKKHVVVIRTDGIGDFILFARDFHRFRTLFPHREWRLTLIGNAAWKELAEEWNRAVQQPWFDMFIPVDRHLLRISNKFRRQLAQNLRSLRCDALIYPVHGRDMWGSIFASWVTSQLKIAPSGDNRNLTPLTKWWFDRQYTRLISPSPNKLLEKDLLDDFLVKLGEQTPLDKKFTQLPLTPEMERQATNILNTVKLDISTPYGVIFPGASWEWKRWPKENFISVGKQILAKTKHHVLLICGSAPEIQLCEDIAHALGSRALSVAGKTSLIALAGLIGKSEFCISNDTVAVHLAAAFNKPTVCILGGGDWGRFWPYGDSEKFQTLHYQMPCYDCDWECRFVINKNAPRPCIEFIDANKFIFPDNFINT